MGLISNTVIISWNSRMKSYYIDKGYIFTNLGDKFEINVEDLPDYSSEEVMAKCDCEDCKSQVEKSIKWYYYLKNLKKYNKYICRACVNKQIVSKKMIQTKIKRGKSFEQWCEETNNKDILNRWDYELNDKLPSEVTYSSSKKKYWFKCPIGIHDSELKTISEYIRSEKNSLNCKQCNSFAQYLIDLYGENALDLYWSYEENTVNPWKIDKSSDIEVYIRCQEKIYHKSYLILCSNFTKGHRCPYCVGKKVHPLDSLGKLLEDKDLLNLWSDKNNKSPYTYSLGSGKSAYWKCENKLHKDYLRTINSNVNVHNFRCPQCVQERNESFLQEKVRLYLESLEYTIMHEYDCSIVPINPKTKYLLPFDNEVKELKLIIEVNGLQHYKASVWSEYRSNKNNTTPEYELHMQQVRDRYKRIFAKSQGFFYLEIPYWTDNKKEEWKQLIDKTINKII